ncbi:hypothetical protein ABT247_14580 [Kitasatospora sp. NPDC001539]|uniref:hypothetical protein n=1 Tax=Kitasatospora sp. NPDC001539 TaxID=3154384 RepID=UPI00331B56B8
MRITELLRAHATDLDRELRDHDPAAFTRRLAERLTAARRSAPTARERPARPPAAARPPHVPSPAGRPRTDGRADLRRDLRQLCAGVAGAAEPGELALDLELAEKTALRTLGCLLYGMGRTADGVFWWRIAVQYGDELAVHCLAVHYAAEGAWDDAARWAAEAEDLSGPGRLPELAPHARPSGAAELARRLAERYDGEILLTLRDAVGAGARAGGGAGDRPGARDGDDDGHGGGRLGARMVRGRGAARTR